jgi:hypothetical protein
MSGRGRLLAIAAVVALAVTGVLVYRGNDHPKICTGCGFPVSVLVASKQIEKGTTGYAIKTVPLYKMDRVATKQIQSGAFVDPAQLTGEVALTNIATNQPLTASEFGHGSLVGVPGMSERAVVLTSPKEVGAPITVGSHVDVWVTRDGQAAGGGMLQISKPLRDMSVLNVSTSGRTVALRAAPEQAGRLIHFTGTDDRLVLRLHR